MLSEMGCGAHGLGIDGEVVLEPSSAKIVPKSDGGWKDGSGQFDRGRLRARCRRPESQQLVVRMGVKLALPGQLEHFGWGIVEGLIELVDSFVQVGIIATEEDVFVGGIDVPDIGLLDDSFGLPSEGYE